MDNIEKEISLKIPSITSLGDNSLMGTFVTEMRKKAKTKNLPKIIGEIGIVNFQIHIENDRCINHDVLFKHMCIIDREIEQFEMVGIKLNISYN